MKTHNLLGKAARLATAHLAAAHLVVLLVHSLVLDGPVRSVSGKGECSTARAPFSGVKTHTVRGGTLGRAVVSCWPSFRSAALAATPGTTWYDSRLDTSVLPEQNCWS